MCTVPLDRFEPAPDPVAAWKDWTAHLAPVFDAMPQPETRVGASVGMRTFNLGNILVGDVSAPAQRLERSRRTAQQQGVDHVLIQFYRGGTSRVRTERGEAEIRPSDFVVYDLAQPVAVSGPAVQATNILLPRALLGDRGHAVAALHGSALSTAQDPAARLFSSYLCDVVAYCERLGPEHVPGIAEAAAKLCAAALPGSAAGEAGGERRRSLELRAFIQASLADPDLGPEMICARFGMSRATLYRQFEADDGVQNHIRHARLARAMHLLTRADAGPRPRVSSVAYACGFSDEKTFSRAFKRRFGVLPREASADRMAWPVRGSAGTLLSDWIRQLGL